MVKGIQPKVLVGLFENGLPLTNDVPEDPGLIRLRSPIHVEEALEKMAKKVAKLRKVPTMQLQKFQLQQLKPEGIKPANKKMHQRIPQIPWRGQVMAMVGAKS